MLESQCLRQVLDGSMRDRTYNIQEDRALRVERALRAGAPPSHSHRLLLAMRRRRCLHSGQLHPLVARDHHWHRSSHHGDLEQAQLICNVDWIVFFGDRNKSIFSSLAQGQPTHRCASNAPNFSLHTLYFLCRKPKASSAPLHPLSLRGYATWCGGFVQYGMMRAE